MFQANFCLKGHKAQLFKCEEELHQFIASCEQTLEMELKYHIPKQKSLQHRSEASGHNVRIKSVDVLLHRDNHGYGIVVRGSYSLLYLKDCFWLLLS